MWAYVFAVILVGIPGAAGAYKIARELGNDNVTNGVTLLVYATALAVAFAYLLPVGPLTGARHSTAMPTALIASAVVGIAAGLISRWRGKST